MANWYNKRDRTYYGNSRDTYGSSYEPRNRQRSKHSGAKFHATTKNGNPVITGWNYSKRHGIVGFFCFPYKGTDKHTSKNGREWHNWMCEVQPKRGKSFLTPCLYDPRNNRIIIKKFGMVINPAAPNGGYCGTYSK